MSAAESSLPIFDADRQLLVSKGQFKEVASQEDNDSSFLRYVYTAGPYNETLDERIERTETELSLLAASCGALIVKHTYGLYPIEDPKYLQLVRPQIIPDGYLLAAEVNIVQDQPTFKPRPLKIYRGIMRYKDKGGTLCDIRAGQFTWGRQRDDPEQQKQWFMLDIEPRHTHPNMRQYVRL